MEESNRLAGGRFEQELARRLADAGFWVHVMQQNKAGQPADLIAVKGKFHTLIDCKVVGEKNGFPFTRIEENQRFAMRSFTRKTGELCYFALKLADDSVWMISLSRLETLAGRGAKGLSDDGIRKHAWDFESWLSSSETWKEDV
jgi:Holliday junction resolvase